MGTTVRRTRGAAAEEAASLYLAGLGWNVIARNVQLGGVEVDILAVEPGPPSTVVVVEVRGLRSAQFGAPEESIDRTKVARLYRALAGLRDAESLLTDAGSVGAVRVDLVVVDQRPGRDEIRHLRALEPP